MIPREYRFSLRKQVELLIEYLPYASIDEKAKIFEELHDITTKVRSISSISHWQLDNKPIVVRNLTIESNFDDEHND